VDTGVEEVRLVRGQDGRRGVEGEVRRLPHARDPSGGEDGA